MTSISDRQTDGVARTAHELRPEPAAPHTDPLLCALGWHRTGRLARWNDGYYFSRCSRCGRELVRAAFGRWTVPRGYRVVWSSQPLHEPQPVRLVREDAVAPPQGREEAAEPIAAQAGTPTFDTAPVNEHQVLSEQADRSHAETEEPWEELESIRHERSPLDASNVSNTVSVGATVSDEFGARPLPIEEVLRSLREDRPRASPLPSFFADMPEDEPYVIAPPAGRAEPLEDEPIPAGKPAAEEPVEQFDEVQVPTSFVSPEPAELPSTARPLIPDFMDDEAPLAVPYDLRTGRLVGPLPVAEPAPPTPPRLSERVGQAASRARAAVRRPPRIRVSEARGGDVGAPSDRRSRGGVLERYAGIVASFIFGTFVLAAALVDRSEAGLGRSAPVAAVKGVLPLRPAAARPSSPAVVAATAPVADGAPNNLAFITASLLNCRAVPSDDGEPVRRLARGAPVRVLGVDPGWVSVSHEGQQCWASARYVSTTRPL